MKKIFWVTLFLSIILNLSVPSILQNLILKDRTKVDDYLSNNPGKWSPAQQIPEFESRTGPPVMIADQMGTVHAFSSQWIGEEIQNPQVAILYNQWSVARGWMKPFDIILPAERNEAWIMDALLDQHGIFHIIFISGDNTDYNVYYSKAPVEKANQSTAWSSPKIIGTEASDVRSASFKQDGAGFFYLLFVHKTTGINFSYSLNEGNTWTKPMPISLTRENELIPSALHLYLGQSGILHAIWNEVTSGGQGRVINYSQLKIGQFIWSLPAELALAPSGFGTNVPSLFEYKDELLALYIDTGKIFMRRSTDYGRTWAKSSAIFPNHNGVNGSLSFVIDNDERLHLFFGQRISGRLDIHGMWHSEWNGEYWSDPEPIASGPRVMDGKNSFDPYGARAVIIQGSTILVTWRTDPGSGEFNENGVWYSYNVLSTSKTSLIEKEITPMVLTRSPESKQNIMTPTIKARQETTPSSNDLSVSSENIQIFEISSPILIGFMSVFLLIITILVWNYILHRRKF